MSRIDALAELWDRRKGLCLSTAVVVLASWGIAHKWLPEGFGGDVYQGTDSVPVVGPPEWNARLRFIAREKEQYLGEAPSDADAGELYDPVLDVHTSFRNGHASLALGADANLEGAIDVGNSPVLTIASLPDGPLATGAEDGSIKVWDAPKTRRGLVDGMKLRFIMPDGAPVTALAFNDSGTMLASGGDDGAIRIWDLSKKGRLITRILDQKGTVYGLAFSNHGTEIWSAGTDGVIRVWRWATRESLQHEDLRDGPIYFVTPEPFFQHQFGVPVYSPQKSKDWLGFTDPEERQRVFVAVSPDRHFVAVVLTGSVPYLSIWELGHDAFPFGLRYRGRVPQGVAWGGFQWSEDSTALCFQRTTSDSACRWLNALTGKFIGPNSKLAVGRSILHRSILHQMARPGFSVVYAAGDRTFLDRVMARMMLLATDSGATMDIGYVSPRFPLLPIELFVWPAILGALALLIWWSPYWKRKRSFTPATTTVRRFFAGSGVETSELRPGLLRVTRLDPPLTPYAPMPAVIATGPADESHVELMVEQMKALHGANRAAGFLFYREPPNALALLRMAEARLKQLAVIPIPLAAAERAESSASESRALLNEYAERYLPGRNFFDDRNAIGDAVAFFGRGPLLVRLEQELLSYQSVGLWGLRKSGKTSILLQLEQIFRNRAAARIGLEPFTAQAPFGNRIFNEILRQMRETLRRAGSDADCPEFSTHGPARDSVSGFLRAMQELAVKLVDVGVLMPIVVMLDEMERVMPIDAVSAEEFNVTFGALRNLCQDRRIMSMLVTDLFPDSAQINQWRLSGAGTNPLFSFLKSAYAGPFDEAETVQMIGTLGNLMNFPFEASELTAIHMLSGGHPFLARQVAAMLYERRDDGAGRHKLLGNPIRYSETLRSYFPENVWSPLERRGDAAALAVLTALADEDGWLDCTELQARCGLAKTVFWGAVEWLSQTGVIARGTVGGRDEQYRISMGMFALWFRQSEVPVRL